MKKRRAFSLVEIILSLAVFSILLIVLAQTLGFTQVLVGRIQGQADADYQLKRAATSLQRDLSDASYSESAVAAGQIISGARLSDCLWFLGARDPADVAQRKQDGYPFWAHNVVYYATIPTNHDQVFGQSCSIQPNGASYDEHCPHKVLIRLEVDQAPFTNFADEDSEETLLASPAGLLGQPTGLNAQSLVTGNVRSAQIVATNLVAFRCWRPGLNTPNSLEFELRALSLQAARRRLRVGFEPVGNSALTTEWRWTSRPGMP